MREEKKKTSVNFEIKGKIVQSYILFALENREFLFYSDFFIGQTLLSGGPLLSGGSLLSGLEVKVKKSLKVTFGELLFSGGVLLSEFYGILVV